MNKEMLLSVEGLTIGFYNSNRKANKKTDKDKDFHTVVNQVTFSLIEGEILGIVGESGSGKSLTAFAVMDLLPESAVVTKGRILYQGSNLLRASKEELRALKGTETAMIFQEPMTSFNPVLTVGEQVEEMLRLHGKADQKEYKEKTLMAFQEAGLEQAEEIYHRYPHELSGGMRQRAMIAMAMILGPKLLIADEPTTALDVTIQNKILKQLKQINELHGTSIILVSHDLSVIKNVCNRTLVMKDGIVVESGDVKEIFQHPRTDYTKELIAAVPSMWTQYKMAEDHGNRMEELPKELQEKKHKEMEEGMDFNQEVVLQVDGLKVSYQDRVKNTFGKKQLKQVVNNVSLRIVKGEALGLVGESGSGKTTLAKAVAGLIKNIEGVISLSEHTLQVKMERYEKPQMVFQDPYSSLNPAKKIRWILEEPLKIHGGFTRKERKERVLEVVHQVGLGDEHLSRYVSQLSGGQRQRVAIASALILYPKLIILDEPVSSLDVTVQAQILRLLKELKHKYQLSYLFISHDLNVIYQICDRVCVMYQGEIVETGSTDELFSNPTHAYSKELLESHSLL